MRRRWRRERWMVGQLLRCSVAVCVGAAFAVALSAPASASFPGRNGLLAFSWPLGCPAFSLGTVRPNGEGLRRLRPEVCEPVEEARSFDRTAPLWSPDGRRLFFAESGKPAFIQADGSGFTLLPGAPRVPETFAPDGDQFAYTEVGQRLSLWKATLDGTENRRIGFGGYPSWSPDGRYMAYMTSPATGLSDGTLWLRNAVSGKRIRQLSSTVGPSDWSPDSRRIVFADAWSAAGGVCVVGKSGRHPPRCYLEGVRVVDVAWSPDGRRIAFVQRDRLEEGSVYSISTITPAGRRLKRLFTTEPAFDEVLLASLEISWQRRPDDATMAGTVERR
jgi:Tol biopolymer transport system component